MIPLYSISNKFNMFGSIFLGFFLARLDKTSVLEGVVLAFKFQVHTKVQNYIHNYIQHKFSNIRLFIISCMYIACGCLYIPGHLNTLCQQNNQM